MNSEPTVAVVCGGPAAEAEVSRVSGKEVAAALRQSFASVTLLELDAAAPRALIQAMPGVVFPALHGPPGEDGTFQGFLETAGLAYVGSGVRASSLAMDKPAAKAAFRIAGLPVAADRLLVRGASGATAAQTLEALGGRVVVKPARQGSALGVSLCRRTGEVVSALMEAFRYDETALVEELIEGKEITCAVLERNGVEALPVIEVRTPQGAWYDYAHRYQPGFSEHVIPAALPEAVLRRVQQIARAAFVALDCRDLARADFIVPADGEPVLLEVNTLPGMTPTSLFPDAAKAAGIPFPALVAHLVQRAWARRARVS